MNIFVTNPCPYKSAEYLDNRRVVKMILESMQILSTVISHYGGNAPYKPTHKNHPVVLWAQASKSNSLWLFEHFLALCGEYTKRYNKIHKCEQYASQVLPELSLVPEIGLTPFVNCTNFQDIEDVFLAYQIALNEKWDQDLLKGYEPKWSGN